MGKESSLNAQFRKKTKNFEVQRTNFFWCNLGREEEQISSASEG